MKEIYYYFQVNKRIDYHHTVIVLSTGSTPSSSVYNDICNRKTNSSEFNKIS